MKRPFFGILCFNNNPVRMLLKSGHRQIYISRQFAIKHGFLPKKFGAANGGFAYAGILPLPGPITLTIGSRTSAHKAYVTEENKFDVILGRAWIEKMGVKCVFFFFFSFFFSFYFPFFSLYLSGPSQTRLTS